MIRIEFTEEAIGKLRYERFHRPHPRVQRKMEALLSKSDALPHRRITRSTTATSTRFQRPSRIVWPGRIRTTGRRSIRCSHCIFEQ